MIRRRDLLLGGLALGSLALAEGLRPRKRLRLLQRGTIGQSLPDILGPWTSQDTTNLVGPEAAGRLAQSLYSEIVPRIYTRANGDAVMLLAAYGDTQSDLLQLHRPESCYPAVGFSLQSTKAFDLPLSGTAVLPARQVVATKDGRAENILYWTRMGELIPQSSKEQRQARLENAMRGLVTDGILVRFSVVGESAASFAILNDFVPQMLSAIDRAKRPALIGTRLTREMV